MDRMPLDQFILPPITHTVSGAPRRVGFEFEYTGLDVSASAEAVKSVFGGVHESESTFVHKIRETPLGEFTVEIDTSILKEKKYETTLKGLGVNPEGFDTTKLEHSLMQLFSTLVPFEIVTPPLPFDQLSLIEELREILRVKGAKGTKTSVFYAFGFHLNIEIPSHDTRWIQRVLQAFVLLYPWIKKRVEVDLTRKLSPYIAPFSDAYAHLILSDEYPVSTERFIEEYLKYNPTRNRPLDLLPVLAGINEEKIHSIVESPHLVKARPAFHYRMPNCLVDEKEWSIINEWNTWVAVERLASDEKKLTAMAERYRRAEEHFFHPLIHQWPTILEQYL